MLQYTAIIPSAGMGKRMGAGKNKMLLEIQGKSILFHTMEIFEKDPNCEKIVVVLNEDDEHFFKPQLTHFEKPITIARGGKERQESVYAGLVVAKGASYVLVHDGARMFVTQDIIARVFAETRETGAAICGVPAKDTIKRVRNNQVMETVAREELWNVQTPQGFAYEVLEKAYQEVGNCPVTDEASLVEYTNHPVSMVFGSYENIKITTPDDLQLAEFLWTRRNVRCE